jgi:hypothetical protein
LGTQTICGKTLIIVPPPNDELTSNHELTLNRKTGIKNGVSDRPPHLFSTL